MTTRSDFFGVTAAAATTAVAASGGIARAAAPAGVYDFAAIEARLARPARHRQVFAVARIAGGTPLGLVTHALDAYEVTMNEGAGSLHPAAVVYARGVVLGLNDRMWTRYRLTQAAHRRGEIVDAPDSGGNPFASSLATLTGRGLTIFVCDNALADWATFLATTMGRADASPDDIRADLRANLAPGALLVPAGVAALNATQEARFTFVQASL